MDISQTKKMAVICPASALIRGRLFGVELAARLLPSFARSSSAVFTSNSIFLGTQVNGVSTRAQSFMALAIGLCQLNENARISGIYASQGAGSIEGNVVGCSLSFFLGPCCPAQDLNWEEI